MKIAYFDCPFGAAGDMLLGALLDAGLAPERWLAETRALALPSGSFEIKIDAARRCSVAATRVEVVSRIEDEERHLSEIAEIIQRSAIATTARELALKIFSRLAEAEAAVHGVTPDEVHFHEVGAVDAIVDIVGFAIAYDMLEIERSVVSPLPLGSGTVETQHGLFPVPGPAVINLLAAAGAPTVATPIDFECLTPTGAAILCEIASSWGEAPAMNRVIASGYGAGSKDPQGWPNVTRVILGSAGAASERSARFRSEPVEVIEATIDDSTPQLLAHAMDVLLKAGALDVSVTPTMMKKGRSGHTVSVVCLRDQSAVLQELILTETSSLGVRRYPADRLVAERSIAEVRLDDGSAIRVKVGRDIEGKIVNVMPEHDDCARYATVHGVSLKEVFASALVGYMKQTDKGEGAG